MDFALNEQQGMLRSAARDFLKTECPKTLIRDLEESDSGHSPELWHKMAALDWMGVVVPEDYGGLGWTLLDAAVLFEEFGRAALPGPMFGTILGALGIVEGGAERQKADLLPGVSRGEVILTLAFEEPEAINNPRYIAAEAKRDGADFAINGTKMFVPYAHVADKLVTAVRTDGRPGDERGISLVIVDAKAPGVSLTPIKTIAADKQLRVDFANVRAGADAVLGEVDNGLSLMASLLEKATAIQCAEMVGGAEQELDMTAQYTKERVQFDRPIGTFQAVQHRLADMYIDVNAARWTTYQAVWRLSQGMPAAREVAIAKYITGSACRRVAFSAQQLHGGIGVDVDYDLHYYYRRQKALELRLGTPAVHLSALEVAIGL